MFRAQMDELQKKQDKINFMRTGKSSSSIVATNSKEVFGESSTKRPLPGIKSSRTSSYYRAPLKRLTTVMIFILSEYFYYLAI